MRKLILVSMVGILSACQPPTPTQPQAKDTQAKKAQAAANTLQFTENAEIDNIKQRLELTANPGLLGFVLLLNEAGQPIAYYGVKGKITSSGKRLTPVQNTQKLDCGDTRCDLIFDAPSDEGTYGSSDPYVYFWTTDGQFIQWNGKYLYSDKPFRTSIEPLVISVQDNAS